MADQITQKQKEVYDFLLKYTNDKGYPPSVREICEAVSLKSTSTVHGHLKRLEKKGYIYRDLYIKPRALEIVELANKKEMISIPIVGQITAGEPILAVENIEDNFQLPIDYVKHNKDLFILKVSGESMIEAGILDGDLAIEKCTTALNGEIVVVMIGEEATIKRFFKEKNQYRLQPENRDMKPIIVKECSILGKLVGIYRNY